MTGIAERHFTLSYLADIVFSVNTKKMCSLHNITRELNNIGIEKITFMYLISISPTTTSDNQYFGGVSLVFNWIKALITFYNAFR